MEEHSGPSMVRKKVFGLPPPFENRAVIPELELRLPGLADSKGEINVYEMTRAVEGRLETQNAMFVNTDLVTPCMALLFAIQIGCLTFRTWRYRKYYRQRHDDFRVLVHAVGFMDMAFGSVIFVGYLHHMGLLRPPWSARDADDECGDVLVNPVYVTDLLSFGTVMLWAAMCSLIRRLSISVIFSPREDPMLSSRLVLGFAIFGTVLLDVLQFLLNSLAVPLDTEIWFITYYCENIMIESTTDALVGLIIFGVIVSIWTTRKATVKVPIAGPPACTHSLKGPCRKAIEDAKFPVVCYNDICDTRKTYSESPCHIPSSGSPSVKPALSTASASSSSLDCCDHTEPRTNRGMRYMTLALLAFIFVLSWSRLSPLSFHAMSLVKYPVVMTVIASLMIFSNLIYHLARDTHNYAETIIYI